ncbi:MAG TPA: hypothetical protein VLU25_20255 [Acidobacteriota bacterium]|nr:hypothetical protein [Acidobacteriota bacterium]
MSTLFSNRAGLIGIPLVLLALLGLYLDYGHWLDGEFLNFYELRSLSSLPAGSIVTVSYAPCYKIDEDGFHLRTGEGESIHVRGRLEGLTVGARAILQGRLLADGSLQLIEGRTARRDWFKKYAGLLVLFLLLPALLLEFRRGWGQEA